MHPLILALERRQLADLCESQSSLGYTVSNCLKKQQKIKKENTESSTLAVLLGSKTNPCKLMCVRWDRGKAAAAGEVDFPLGVESSTFIL